MSMDMPMSHYDNMMYLGAKTGDAISGTKKYTQQYEMHDRAQHPEYYVDYDPNRIRRSYFSGWNSVADYDKQAFLKKHPEMAKLKGREADEFLKNIIFRDVFKNSNNKEDQEVWRNKSTLSRADRDLIFARKTQTADLDGFSDIAEGGDGPAEYKRTWAMARIHKSYAQGMGPDNTMRGIGRKYLNQRSAPLKNEYLDKLENLSTEEQNSYIERFEEASKSASGYFEKYNGTDKLSLSRGQKLELLAQYMADQDIAGPQYANKSLGNFYQNTVAEKQSFTEKLVNSGVQFADSAIGMVVRAAGMSIAASGIDRLFGFNQDKGYLENIIDNGITRYGDRIATTNSYDHDEQLKLERMGMSDNPILETVNEQNAMFSWNTPFNLFGQYGFTAASTIMTFGGSLALKGITAGASWATKLATAGKGAKAIAAGSKFIQGITKSESIGNILVAGAVGTIEGGMNAAQTRQSTLNNAMEQIKAQAYKDLINDPNLAGSTPEEREENARILSNDENFLKQHYGDAVAQAEEVAKTAMYQDFWTNSAINGLIDVTLKAGLQAPRIQKSLRKLGIKKDNLDDAFDIVKDDKVWKATAKKVTTKDVIVDRVKESFGEAIEEYKQELSSSFAEGYATNKMQQYIDAKYNNGQIGDAVETDVWQAIAAGMAASVNSAVSAEAMKSFIYGGLSTMMGGFNVKNPTKWKKGEGLWSNIQNISPIAWRGAWTPLINHSERDARNEQRKAQEKHLTEFFSDKEVQNALFNAEGTATFLHELEEGIKNGDEKVARDARLASMFSSVITLNELKDSGYYETVMASLQARANFKKENLDNLESAESKAVDMFIADVQNRDMEYTREEALEQITKSSSRMLEVIDKVGKESSNIDKLFGKGLDPDVKASLVYNRLTIEDSKKRIEALDKDLAEVTSAIDEDPTSKSSNVNNDIKDIIVKYGSVENAVKKKEEIQTNIERTEKALKEIQDSAEDTDLPLKERVRLKRLARWFSKELDSNKKNLKALEDIESTYGDRDLGVLTAQDIMRLDASERAQMLSKKNRDKYSAEQQVEIDKLLGIGNSVHTDFAAKIVDRARLENDYIQALQSQSDMMTSSKALEQYAYSAKKKVVDKAYAIKNQQLLDLENKGDYEAFSQELEKVLNSENSEEIRVVRDILSESEFYRKYMKEKKKRDSIRDFVDLNDDINVTSKEADVFSAMLDYLSANGVEATSIDDAVSALSETTADEVIGENGKTELTNRRLKFQDYLDKINEALPDDKKISISNLGKSLQIFKDIIGEYNKNIAEQAKLSKESKPAQTKEDNAAKPADVEDIPVEAQDTDKKSTDEEAETDAIPKQEYEEPIVNKVAKNNKSNIPVVNQAEFVVGRIRSSEHRYGQEAVDAALQALDAEIDTEFTNEEDFNTAIKRAENKLIASMESEKSIESYAASILKAAREEYDIHVRKQLQKSKQEAAKAAKAAEVKQKRRGLFQRGSDKYVDHLTEDERLAQETHLARVLDGLGTLSEWLSPEANSVELEYLAKSSLINSVNVRGWRNMPQNLQQYWRTHDIDAYLTSKSAQDLKSKPVFFYSPELNGVNEKAADYDYTIDAPLVAIVEDPNGKVVIGDKKYQPIGLMPRSYDGAHNRIYHVSAVNGTAHLLNIRKSIPNSSRGELITDENGTPIQTRITSFVTGSRVATSPEYKPAQQVNIDNFSESEKEEMRGKSKLQVRATRAYKRAKERFVESFVSKGGVTKCFIRMHDNYGRPIGGEDGLSHIMMNSTTEEFGNTVARNSDSTFEQVLTSVLENDNNYYLLYDSRVPYNEGGFNRRTQSIGKGLQNFFKNTFKLADIESLPNDKQKIAKLNEYAQKLRSEVFVQKYGVYFNSNQYSFVFIPSGPVNGKPGYTLSLRDNFSEETFPLAEVTEGEMSDKTAAKVMANLFMYGGQMRHGFKWQIDAGEINILSGTGNYTEEQIEYARQYIGENYDDGIFQTAKTRLAYEVNQITIQNPYNSEGVLINPTPIIPKTVNTDNANINSTQAGTITTARGEEVIPETGTSVSGKVIEEKDERELTQEEKEAKGIGEFIQNDSKDWALTEDQKGYENKKNPGVKHARVTSTIYADKRAELGEDGKPKRMDPNSVWSKPSTLIGNAVDEFIRDFFDGLITDDYDFKSLPNAGDTEWRTLYEDLKAFRDGYVKDRNLTIIPKNVVAHGSLTVKDSNGREGIIPVAGTLDILAYDSEGNFYVFDMKTYRSELNSKLPKYARQVSVYSKLIEQRLAEQGIDMKFKGLSIIPIRVRYPDARDYEYREIKPGSNQLVMGRRGTNKFSRFMGARMKLGVPVNVDYVEPDILFERLTEEEQALVRWKDEDPPVIEKREAPGSDVTSSNNNTNTGASTTDTGANTNTGINTGTGTSNINTSTTSTTEPSTRPEEANTKKEEEKKKEENPETPPATSPGTGPIKRAIRGRRKGSGLNIGGITEEEKRKLGSIHGDVQKSLIWLKNNNPEGYEIADKFNKDRMDDTAWDNLSDEVKDSYLNCLGNK